MKILIPIALSIGMTFIAVIASRLFVRMSHRAETPS